MASTQYRSSVFRYTFCLIITVLQGCQTAPRIVHVYVPEPIPAPPTPLITNRAADVQRITPYTVETEIHKGKTTKAEAISILGTPSIMSRDQSNREILVWERSYNEQESASSSGKSVTVGMTRNITVAITLNRLGVVDDVKVRTTAY